MREIYNNWPSESQFEQHDEWWWNARGFYRESCAHCGGTFIGWATRLYCCTKCQRTAAMGRRKVQRKQQQHERPLVACTQCGGEIPVHRSTKRFCSDACRQAAYRARQTRELQNTVKLHNMTRAISNG
jgi:hypothetical protein